MLSLHQQLLSQAMRQQLYLNSKLHLHLNNSSPISAVSLKNLGYGKCV